MAYLRSKDFEILDDLGRTPLRTTNDDDFFLQRRIDRATESYSPPLTTLLHGNEFSTTSKHRIQDHESRIQELEHDLRRSIDLEEKHGQTIRQLRQVLEATEKESSDLSKSRSKAQLTISTLQSDNRQLQDRISDLESRLRRNLEERDETNHSALHWERNYEQLRLLLCKMVFPDGLYEGRSHEAIVRKLEDYFDEQTKLKLQSMKLQEDIAKTKDEARTEREALKKVLDELERTKKHSMSVELLREEKEISIRKQKQLEEELVKMEERLLRSQERYESVQSELRDYRSKLTDVDTLTRRQNLAAQASALELKSFKETLAALLSDVYTTVQPTEESLKDKIRHLALNRQEVDQVSKHLETKLQELSKQLEEQAHLHKNAVQRSRKAEEEVEKLRERMKVMEGELTATDILKNGLKVDKQKYSEFCQQLAHVMKLDSIANELGMDLNGEALLARAEQLASLEQEGVTRKRSQSLVVERQLKEAKKLLESKDLHLDVLRKKLASVEQEASHRAEKDWQELVEKHQRLKKHNEKLERQLTETKMNVNQLAQHGETAETLRRTCEHQRKTIAELEKQLSESEQLRQKQSKKIQHLKAEKDHSEAEMSHQHHTVRAAESNMEGLLDENQRMKQQLAGSVQREKQLLDLRQVIARMLGLDAQTLAVPDYEIIRRLETLVETQNELTLFGQKQESSHAGRRNPPHSGLPKSSSFGMSADSNRRSTHGHHASGMGNMSKRFK